jgi:putative transcriptional regulator
MSPPSHRNRSKNPHTPGRDPKPDEIRAARDAAGLTQTQAADLIHSTLRTWQDWEGGVAPMRPYAWGYFLISVGSVTAARQLARYRALREAREQAPG